MFDQIPIKTIVNESSIFPGFFLAKSGIKFRNDFGKSRLICGFGFNNNYNAAFKSSRFEVLEHLYATYDFNKANIQKNNFFFGIPLKNQLAVPKAFFPREVIIGPIPECVENCSDANGLGCHQYYENAISHAILEIIERHLLALIWYGPLLVNEIQLGDSEKSNYRIRFFTSILSIPFAIVIIDDLEKGVWALGSAVRTTIESAIEHAKHEAMMLIESTFIENGLSYSEDIEQRILSLRNENFTFQREKFLNSKKAGDTTLYALNSMQTLDKMIAIAFGENSEIWVIDLFKSKTLNVVRVLCSEAQNPRWHRDHGLGVPYDPFC